MDDSDSDAELIALYIYVKRRKLRKRHHNIWVHDINKSRHQYGEYHHLVRELFSYEDKFFIYFRMVPETFHEIHTLIKDDIQKQNTFWRQSIGTEERLSVCLRFLATGDSYSTIAFSFRMGVATVSKIIVETCQAIWNRLQPMFMPTPTNQLWSENSDGFQDNWQFPNCLGALDGKHVLIFAPKKSGTMFFNYKKTFSVVLLALVDYRYRFVVVDIGSYGSNSDGGILRKSVLGRKLADNTLQIPDDKPLPGFTETDKVPYVIVGDEAFPSGEHLMRPVPGPNLAYDERIYNYRLSRARRISENCFGILVARWRMYHRKIPLQPSNVDHIVKATCILHNMLQMKGIPVPPPPTDQKRKEDDSILRDLDGIGGRQPVDALVVREKYKRYFVSAVGSVPWQDANCFGHSN